MKESIELFESSLGFSFQFELNLIAAVVVANFLVAHLDADAAIYNPVCWADSSVAKDRLSDAGCLGFESQTGGVRGESSTSLWRDKRPASKGLRPPEHYAGRFRPDQTRLLRVKRRTTYR